MTFTPSPFAPTNPHRAETIIAKRPLNPPTESWWVGHPTRESFNARHAQEMQRIPTSYYASIDRVSYAENGGDDERRWRKGQQALAMDVLP